jgi:uncharacterized protein YbbK (DUF523 family)
MKLCSACLLGIKCRYDANDKQNNKVLELAQKEALIPVCPEQLGGLPTPRSATEIKDNRVLTKSGKDLTESFQKGAQEVLKLAKLLNIKGAIFKAKSPSCGCGQIYDGTFSGKLTKGNGITTRLLQKNGIKITTEEEL